MYAIKWKNKITDATGTSGFVNDKNKADEVCDKANTMFQEIHHWVVEGEPED